MKYNYILQTPFRTVRFQFVYTDAIVNTFFRIDPISGSVSLIRPLSSDNTFNSVIVSFLSLPYLLGNKMVFIYLTLLHSEVPKIYAVLAFLSAVGLKNDARDLNMSYEVLFEIIFSL